MRGENPVATWRTQALCKGSVDTPSQVLSGWDAGQVLPDAMIFKEELKIHIL